MRSEELPRVIKKAKAGKLESSMAEQALTYRDFSQHKKTPAPEIVLPESIYSQCILVGKDKAAKTGPVVSKAVHVCCCFQCYCMWVLWKKI